MGIDRKGKNDFQNYVSLGYIHTNTKLKDQRSQKPIYDSYNYIYHLHVNLYSRPFVNDLD